MTENDRCFVFAPGLDDTRGEVFETGDSELATAMWLEKHGADLENEVSAHSYSSDEIDRCYRLGKYAPPPEEAAAAWKKIFDCLREIQRQIDNGEADEEEGLFMSFAAIAPSPTS